MTPIHKAAIVLPWLALCCGCATHAPASGGERFVSTVPLANGMVCVVAEGDLEPRSIGTYSVRVYRDLHVGDYIAGAIQRRDGFVRRAYRGSPDGSGRDVIAVEVETAGSGRYAHAETFVFDASARAVRPTGAE